MHATSLWLHFIAFGSLRHAGLCAVHVIAGRREIHTSGWLELRLIARPEKANDVATRRQAGCWLVHAGIEHTA
jgi:hypothetical protein